MGANFVLMKFWPCTEYTKSTWRPQKRINETKNKQNKENAKDVAKSKNIILCQNWYILLAFCDSEVLSFKWVSFPSLN